MKYLQAVVLASSLVGCRQDGSAPPRPTPSRPATPQQHAHTALPPETITLVDPSHYSGPPVESCMSEGKAFVMPIHTLEEEHLTPPVIHEIPVAVIHHPTATDRDALRGEMRGRLVLRPVCGVAVFADTVGVDMQTNHAPSIRSEFFGAMFRMRYTPATFHEHEVVTSVGVSYRFVECSGDSLCAEVKITPASIYQLPHP